MKLIQRIRAAAQVFRASPPIPEIVSVTNMLTGNMLGSTAGNPIKQVEEFRSWVYKAVNRRGQDIGRVRRRVSIDRDQDEYEDLPSKHPLSRLLARPNPFQSGYEFFWAGQMWADLTGNAYILRVRNAFRTAELWLLDARYVRVIPDPQTVIAGYEYTLGTKKYRIAPEDMIHLKYPNPKSYYYGASPLQAAAYSVDIDITAKIHQREFLKHNPTPRIAFEAEGYLTPDAVAALKAQMREMLANKENIGLPLISHQGAKSKVLSLTPQEINYLSTVKNARDEILTTYGVPASVLGISEDVNRANAEANWYTYAKLTLEPLATLWDAVLEPLAMEFGENLIIRHESTVPSDREQDRADMKARLENGMTSINEERRGVGWDPINGGDEPLISVGKIPLSQIGIDPLADPQKAFAPRVESTENPDEAAALLLSKSAANRRAAYWKRVNAMHQANEKRMTGTMRRYFGRQAETVLSRMQKSYAKKSADQTRSGDPLVIDDIMFDEQEWNAILEELGLRELQAVMPEAFAFAIAEIDGTMLWNADREAVRRMMADALDKLKNVNLETKKQITETLSEGLADGESTEQLTERVLDVFEDATRYRARMIARTTMTQGINRGMLDAWQKEKDLVDEKMWITARDNDVRDAHKIDGQTRKVNQPFDVGGEKLMYPGDPNGSPGNIINERCFMAPVKS